MTQFTYYRWRKEFGGLMTDQVKWLKEPEKDRARCSPPGGETCSVRNNVIYSASGCSKRCRSLGPAALF